MTDSLIASIAAFLKTTDRDYHFPFGNEKKYPLLTSPEQRLAIEFSKFDRRSDVEASHIRHQINASSGYDLVILSLRMALLAFRNKDVAALSHAAIPLLLSAHAIDSRDLLRAVALYSDGCRRLNLDPLTTLKTYMSLAEGSAWATIEHGFFARDRSGQHPRKLGNDAPFDSPNSIVYLDL